MTVTDASGVQATRTVRVTAAAQTYTVEATPSGLDFGERSHGYTLIPASQTVTIRNTGNWTVMLDAPASGASQSKFTLGALSDTSLAPGETATFTVQPLTSQSVGTHSETITVFTGNGTSASVNAAFEVLPAPTVNITPAAPSIVSGDSVRLTAAASGGTGGFAYLWNTNDAAAVIDVSPGTDTEYTVTATDSSGSAVQTSVYVHVAPEDYTFALDRASVVWEATMGYTQLPAAETVKITGTGNRPLSGFDVAVSGSEFIAAYTSAAIAVGETAAFTVQPVAGLAAGRHTATVTVTTPQGTSQTLDVAIVVYSAPTVMIGGDLSIKKGQETKLTANVTGGKAPYTYLWSTTETVQEITVAPVRSTGYIVTVEDALGNRANASATVSVKIPSGPTEDPDTDETPEPGGTEEPLPAEEPGEATEPESISGIGLIPTDTIKDPAVREEAEKEASVAIPFDFGAGQIVIIIPVHDGTLPADLPNRKAAIESVLSLEELGGVAKGDVVEIRMDVELIRDSVPEEDRDIIETACSDIGREIPNFTFGAYVDVTLQKRINGGDWSLVRETNAPLDVQLVIPGELRKDTAEFSLIRSHDGEYALLSDTDNDPETITVQTNCFSTYAIAYRAAEKAAVSCLWHWFVLGAALLYAVFALVWKNTNKLKRLVLLIYAVIVMIVLAVIGLITNGCNIGLFIAAGGILVGIAANLKSFLGQKRS